MKKFLIIICVGSVLSSVLFSCSDAVEPATVEYYLTASESGNYESLSITFDYTRAYTEGSEPGTTAISTVYLDSQELSLTTDGTQEPIFLGASTIGPGKIYGYDFGFSSISVVKSGVTMAAQHKNYDESNKVEKEIVLTPGEVRQVIFSINTDESLSVQANNELKFLAKIQY